MMKHLTSAYLLAILSRPATAAPVCRPSAEDDNRCNRYSDCGNGTVLGIESRLPG